MSDRMPKIDLNKLSATDRDFIRRIQDQNNERVAKLKRLRKNNLITASILGACVFGIYGYSIYSVRQETFLDDFEVPKKTTE